MAVERLKLLEEKVNKIMELMVKLKKENEELAAKNLTLQTKLDEKEKAVMQLAEESGTLQSLKEENESLKQDKEIVHSKVDEILAQLEEMDVG